jgi:predicted GNAT superfamily acetyltransferase
MADKDALKMEAAKEQLIVIRDVTSIEEMRDVEELQQRVWNCSERDIIPAITLKPAVDVGAILVGAFDAGKLAGFAYGFVGLESGRVIIHSEMLAVRSEYRTHNLGYRLKLAQRDRASARGISHITWTFDPLQSQNAHLNFAKLGVVAADYKINYYGETSSLLHRGLATDRLWVNWPLTSARVRRRLEEGEPSHPALNELTALVRVAADHAPDARSLSEGKYDQQVLIEIPSDITTLQREQPQLAVRWREATRRAFTEALAAGYLVEEFHRLTRDDRVYGVYVLSYGKRLEDFIV